MKARLSMISGGTHPIGSDDPRGETKPPRPLRGERASVRRRSSHWLATILLLIAAAPAFATPADDYQPADQGQRPELGKGPRVLPDQFLRGFDPVTVYFPEDVGPARGPADDGSKFLKMVPSWPGAFVWADRRTLQFRPAEPWPALARFAFEAQGKRTVLTTMMSAPSLMSPAPDTANLRPFRTVTLTFPQALSLPSLKSMLKVEVRDLPGLADSPREGVRDFTLSQLPRASHRDPVIYAVTLDKEIPEGKQLHVNISLALGDEGKVLWTGRVATHPPFHLVSIQCGPSQFALAGGASTPRDLALGCGNGGDKPQLVFSANVKDLTLTVLKRLLRLEPAVADLHFETSGPRVALRGKFIPDVLYRMSLEAPVSSGGDPAATVKDDSGRSLRDPGNVQVYFHLGWKSPFLRFREGAATLEANGPRMLPLVGYGDPRADVRIYRVDALHPGLWPFPDGTPVTVDEQSAPPFPGEEPAPHAEPDHYVEADELVQHLRLLGSPLASKVMDLPLKNRSATTHFGLDIGPALDAAVGKNRPGTYLVGLRRLTGPPQRSYMRVQVTNLSLLAAEERERAVFYVRTLDKNVPVRGARILVEGIRKPRPNQRPAVEERVTVALTTDEAGKAVLGPQRDWRGLHRVSVQSGDDALVLDPRTPPQKFASNHWSPSSDFLSWIAETPPAPANDRLLGFVFTERAIYRPGETVFIKGHLRKRISGELIHPGPEKAHGLKVAGPSGASWALPLSFTALAGFSAEFKEKGIPTGPYTVTLFSKEPYTVIAERTFQVEAYRIPTFEVQLAGAASVPLDAPFKVKALGRYYAGGNVSGAAIAWTVTRRPYHHVPPGRDGYLFASSTQFAREGASRGPEVTTEAGTLDAAGAAEMSVNPALDLDGSARTYRFEATVTGADNQEVTATHDVKALPPFVLGMKLPRYSDKALTLKPEIIAVGVNDKNVKGQELSVRLYRRQWRSVLRETQFATGKAKYVTEQEDVKLLEEALKTDDKPVIPDLPIKEAGVYVVELFARDKLGRVQTLTADLYVGGQSPLSWKKPREGVFELTPDKPRYRPFDLARVIIQSPFQTGQALVVVEEPAGNSYTWLEVTGGKAVHELRLGAHHVPNLPLHVVLTRGRIGEGTAEDSRYRPQTLAASIDLPVEPVKNQVLVGVEHPETARPGSKVDLVVTLKDDKGAPLAGEVTLWLVDEAVLSLAKELPLDPLEHFIPRNVRATSLSDTRNGAVGRLFDQEEEPGGDGPAPELDVDGNATGKPRVRKNFKTVPFYEATLQIPATGRLSVPVKLSDDLTNFRVRAVAASGLSRFGYRQSVLRVRLPVIVQPQLPRFVRQGDRFFAGALGRVVEGSDGPGKVELSFEGPVDGKPASLDVTLKRDKAQSFLAPVSVRSTDAAKASVLKIRVSVVRKSDKVGDAFEVALPVLPDRVVERFAYFDRLKEGRVELRPFPESPRPGTASQEILVTSVPGVLELASGLEYLAEYPHGCLEQKMSQLYPELALGELFRKLSLTASSDPSLGGHAKRLLEELAQHQDEQGLFSFWPGGPGDVALTAQAVEFSSEARAHGIPIDEKVQGRAVEALKRVLRSDFPGLIPDYRFAQQTSALRALSRTGQHDEHYAIALYQSRDQMDITSKAELAALLATQPATYKANLSALKGELWASVVTQLFQGKEVYKGLKDSRRVWGHGYLGSSTTELSAVLEALLSLDPSNEKHALLRDALLAAGHPGRGFGSTHDNRRALQALGQYLNKAKHPIVRATVALAGPDGNLQMSVDEKRKAARLTSRADVPLTATVSAEVGARIAYTYLPATPGERTPPLKQGFLVSRSATLIKGDGSADTYFDDKAGETRKIAVGDILELHARMVSEEDRHHVALVVPFAAGLEPLNPALENASAQAKPSQGDSISPTYVQRLDHEARYYFTRLPRGTHSFHFRVRAATEGSFVHPSPWAEAMYHQEVRGRGEGMRIVVAGPHER
jgi:uncharacterized protein YfaS (alpha-2-macroglobulin family)